jgi:hypothetical protein
MDWTVSCLDCTNPAGTFAVVPDCVHRTFQVSLDLSSTGSATSADVVNSLNTDTLQNVAAGQLPRGPVPRWTAR